MPDSKPAADTQSWVELVKTVFLTLVIVLFLRTFVFQAFNIPSGSMEGTLLVGDYLFIEKYPYGFSRYSLPFGGWPFGSLLHGRIFAHAPKRGDVVVFKMPNRNSPDYMQDFIKRVIGIPGDRVQMIGGELYLNDKPVPKKRVADFVETVDGGVHHVPRYRETLPGGKSFLILDRTPNGPFDNTGVYVVPPGHYFMMGDNRDNSDDSRDEVGYVPFENIEGRAAIRFFSSDGSAHFWEFWKWPGAIRYNRILRPID
jgi:signal peptidase I